MSLGEIAAATGFYDQSHFTKRFRKVTGVTPSEYRKGVFL
jgi:AraC-like DNA-binding protein